MSLPDYEARHVIVFSIRGDETAFLSRSLGSVLGHASSTAPILVLCPDPSLVRGLELAGSSVADDPRVMLHTLGSDAPFSLFEALRLRRELHPAKNLLYVRCGVEVPFAWDERLQFTLEQDSAIGTASPLCDVSPLFNLVSSPVASSLRDSDEVLCRFSPRESVQIPTFLECCVYLRGEALDAFSTNDLLRDRSAPEQLSTSLASALCSAGYVHTLCDHVYVHNHAQDAVQRRMESAVSEEVESLNQRHPLTGLRESVNAALLQGMGGASCVRMPVQLHLVHGWGGGVERWVRDFVANDRSRRNLVLKAVGNWGQFGQRVELFDSPSLDGPAQAWDLYAPIKGIALAHLQYRQVLRSIIETFGVEVVLVSSLIGHSLDVLDTGVETALVLHDYLPFCPALNIFFGEPCGSCEESRLERCFKENPHNRFFTNVSAQEWLAIRRRFTDLVRERPIRFVAPSICVETNWKRLVPELSSSEFHVIPHGIRHHRRIVRGRGRAEVDRLRVLVLGSIADNKGGRLLKEVIPALRGVADFYLVGCGREGAFFADHPGVTVVSSYDHSDLVAVVEPIDPDIGLLASIVPETFSYTLSELFSLGVPPLVSRRGSFEDRVTEGESGFLFDPLPESLEDAIRRLASDRSAVDEVRRKLPDTPGLKESEMVGRYHASIPLPRFAPPRYRGASKGLPVPAAPSLVVDPQATFAEAYRDFGVYVKGKLMASPRLREWQKRTLLQAAGLVFPRPKVPEKR
jgi:glycosyltransferase involved in cell wall biosynthesis